MSGFADFLFVVIVAWMIVHELDAIANHEWRFFFAWTPLSDTTAYRIFAAAHIPLIAFIVWNISVREFQIGFDLFCIGHAGLHGFLRNHRTLEFHNWYSELWTIGAACLALGHLMLLL